MTVKSLIEALQQADQDADVIIWDWNGGNELRNYVQPVLDASNFDGVFMLLKGLSYHGEIKRKS